MVPKKILVVAYVFPPFPGIGGRRWVKFSKYLQRKGHEVHVICAENPFEEQSQWMNDCELPEDHITRLPFRYPRILSMVPRTIAEKINYRLQLFLLKRRTRGNYYDRAVLWKEQLQTAMRTVITKHGIDNIVVTAAPFHLAYYCSELKNEFPEIRFIVDFRDPWTSNKAYLGLASMDASRIAYEQELEAKTVSRADAVITVADEMTSYFTRYTEAGKPECLTILNGYDPDDFAGNTAPAIAESNIIRFVFTGTLYNQTESVFNPFLDALVKLKTERPADYGLLAFDFYGGYPEHYKQRVAALQLDAIRFHGTIPLAAVHHKIQEASLAMLFLHDAFTFSFSTKFYEYLSQHKKIAVFSRTGALPDFVLQHELGYLLQPGDVYKGLEQIIADHRSGRLQTWTSKLDLSQYAISYGVSQLETLLK